MTTDYRIEHDSMGELKVPSAALWGVQTQRAVANFPVSGLRMPRQFIRALGLIKWAAAATNHDLGMLSAAMADAIKSAALEVAEGRHDEHFPVDVFQTGSGTSSNMNANEVIANLAARAYGEKVHPNDHVNMGQSSNDVIPSAIHVSAALGITESLLPALDHLAQTIRRKAKRLSSIVKTGRTHLMDAMPLRFDQELSGWATQVGTDYLRIAGVLDRLSGLAQGGTAVGTGINAHPEFGVRMAAYLARQSDVAFRPAESYFEALSCQDTAVELSGQLKTTAVSLLKIANDLRWMNSGPLAGLGEIELPALQARQQHHAGEDQSRSARGGGDGGGAGDRQRHGRHGGRAIRQLPAQRHASGHRPQSPAEHRDSRQRGPASGGYGDRGVHRERRAPARGSAAQPHSGDRAEPDHRLRQRR